ncbi:protein kinase [Streptomyces sp. NPDC051018]|uniref:serine/threonine-protein kinase n=1 Tax=Streptomyces sp. NPDC051018 TaxID=3365639 RepID=UPI0037AD99FD
MGRVWRAHDEVLHRVVAVKELTAGMYASEADRAVLHARTQKEARAAARISHPGVVTVHDVLEHDTRPWIVMQYVDGSSLAEAARESGRISPLEGARIGLQVLRALGAAHAAGVLHRDVKPGNVLLGKDGRVLITDFGIAAIEGDATITRTGEIVGSIDYLAPERVRGGEPGPASDLWSLGATLYTAVEGASPFRRSSAIASMQAVVDEEPLPPAHAGPLAPVITGLLRKDPADRLPAHEAERMLQDALEELREQLRSGEQPTVPARIPDRASDPTATRRRPRPEPDPPPTPVPVSDASAPGSPEAAPAGDALPAPATASVLLPAHDPVAVAVPAHGPPPGTGGVPAARPPAAPGTVASATRRGRRLRRTAAVVALSLVIGVGAVLVLMRYAGDDSGERGKGRTDKGSTPGVTRTPGPGAPPGTPGTTADPARPGTSGGPETSGGLPEGSGDVPAGWRRVQDPAGFSLFVPDGWERRTQGDQIDYTPDDGLHRLRIGIDPEPDFKAPYAHALALEKDLQRLPDYRRVSLETNGFRGRPDSTLWEFTWTERTTFPGKRSGVDQLYFGDDGTGYALYLTGPTENWAETRELFDTMLASWRPRE